VTKESQLQEHFYHICYDIQQVKARYQCSLDTKYTGSSPGISILFRDLDGAGVAVGIRTTPRVGRSGIQRDFPFLHIVQTISIDYTLQRRRNRHCANSFFFFFVE
jgi:hypothetical protein